MKIKLKRILSIIMCAALLLTAFPAAAFAADEREVVDSGFCGVQGENLTWTLYTDNELVIGGEGEMDWYKTDSATPKLPPWYGYYDRIDVITIEEGVTSIGYQAFSTEMMENGCPPTEYYRITLPKSLEFIEGNFFTHMQNSRIPGQHLAYCYSGTESEWAEVQIKPCTIHYDADGNALERTFDDFGYEPKYPEGKFEGLYFNGKEPENFCRLERYYLHGIDIVTHYYAPDAEKIVWYSVHGDKIKKAGEIPAGEYVTADILLPSIKEGDLYMRAEIVDSQGNTVAVSEDFLIQSIPVDNRTFGEKIEDFFKLGIANAAWTLLWGAYIVLGYIASIIHTPYYIYLWISNALKGE